MRTFLSVFAALAIAAFTLTGAQAGSSQGGAERSRLPIGVEGTDKPETRSVYRTPKVAKPVRDESFVPLGEGVVPQTSWNPFGTVALSEDELAAQLAANQAWRRDAYARARANGRWGYNSVEYETQAWNCLVGGGCNPNATGPLGASIGGSD